MSNNELLTDDYVAELLAQDAKDCSLKYSAMGLEAFRDNKKPSSMLKPNTRFLRHIIRDTDTHNKALLAKEAAESKARLKNLEHAEEAKRRQVNPDARDIRRRQMGDIQAILGGKKRRRETDKGERRSRKTADDGDGRHRSRHLRKDNDLSGGDRKRHGRLSVCDYDTKDSASDRETRRNSRRHRDHSTSDDDDEKYRRRRSRRDRSRSSRRHRSSRSPDDQKRKHRQRSHDRSHKARRASPKQDARPTAPLEEDSDPLEDFIGPPPPAKHRGRGTIGGAAALDRRFSDSYDPKLDVGMENEEDPWDDAVESFRDRQKMRLNQDQRMKDAGFTAEQIQRAKGSDDQAQPDVVWTKAGESREWDKGKGVAIENEVGYEAITFTTQTALFSEDY